MIYSDDKETNEYWGFIARSSAFNHIGYRNDTWSTVTFSEWKRHIRYCGYQMYWGDFLKKREADKTADHQVPEKSTLSEMLTRVGGAILLAETQWTSKSGVSKERAMALAAIEAMHEPTAEMLAAGDLPGWDDSVSVGLAGEVWGAMIEAALK